MISHMETENKSSHFKGKDALNHVIEAQKEGIIASSEVHGQEPSGQLVAFVDSLRDTAVFILLIYAPLFIFNIAPTNHLQIIAFTTIGWIVWRSGRSALLGWSRLERLHRIVEQERWEIEHHRQQEREELTELYHAKGFSGKLLEDVIDVLMSDGDRLLRVMIEEELGLSLEKQEHPLLQASGALLGSLLAFALFLIATLFLPSYFVFVLMALSLILSGYLSAKSNDNQVVPSIVWHVGIAFLSFGFTYFLFREF